MRWSITITARCAQAMEAHFSSGKYLMSDSYEEF